MDQKNQKVIASEASKDRSRSNSIHSDSNISSSESSSSEQSGSCGGIDEDKVRELVILMRDDWLLEDEKLYANKVDHDVVEDKIKNLERKAGKL